jgi:cytochrome c oxidase subunit 4
MNKARQRTIVMAETTTPPNYLRIWYWLIGLALGSVLLSQLPLPHVIIVGLIFAAATAKAVLVALYYMHLRGEQLLIYSLALVPLVLLAPLLLVLLPDIAWR